MKPLRNAVVVLAGLVALATTSRLLAQERGEGPTSLILTYKAEPAKRAAFREQMEKSGAAQFESWKKSGLFADYQILFSSFVNEGRWDMLVVLSFGKYADTARWREVERRHPGGLSPEALALGRPAGSYLCDAVFEGAAPQRDPGKAAYVVIPYEYSDRAQYKAYAEGYVLPQVKGWMAEGILARYAIYLNQHEAGEPWDALFVYEYRDLQALALRRATINKVRAGLASNAEWKKLSDVKADLRKEAEIVIAEALLAR